MCMCVCFGRRRRIRERRSGKSGMYAGRYSKGEGGGGGGGHSYPSVFKARDTREEEQNMVSMPRLGQEEEEEDAVIPERGSRRHI